MSGTLPMWMERWLRLPTGPGEGTAWRLESSWPWPSWLTLLAVIVAVVVIVAIYLREGRRASRRYRLTLAAMRLGLVALVLAMIAQFEVSFQRTGLPYLAVVVDDSRSMTTVDAYPPDVQSQFSKRLAKADLPAKDLSRWNLATAVLTQRDGRLLSKIAENYKLRFYFLTGVRASGEADVPGIVEELKSAEPTGESTRLGAAVNDILEELRGTAPAAIVLLTDGINTEGPSLSAAAERARAKGVPLCFIGMGSDQPIRDIRLSDLLVDDVVFVNDLVNFRFKMTTTGFAGKKVTVTLREDGKPEVLAKMEVTAGPDGHAQEVRLPYRPTQVGRFQYIIDIEPPEGGLQTKNPPLRRSIQVRKAKIRVLLVQAYPSFEYRFLRNMLARDETIELNTVLQDADVEYVEQDKTALRVFPRAA